MAERDAIRVVVADDHPVFREGLARAIGDRTDLDLVGQAEDGREAVSMVEERRPDVAVFDVRMPHLEGLEALETLRARGVETRVVFLSAFGSGDLVHDALSRGAMGFISKEAGRQQICDAIVAVGRGRVFVDQRVEPDLLDAIHRRAEAGREAVLSKRELEILRLASEGRSTTEIADELHLSPETIKSHMKTLFEKLEVPTRTAAVAAALRRGLLE